MPYSLFTIYHCYPIDTYSACIQLSLFSECDSALFLQSFMQFVFRQSIIILWLFMPGQYKVVYVAHFIKQVSQVQFKRPLLNFFFIPFLPHNLETNGSCISSVLSGKPNIWKCRDWDKMDSTSQTTFSNGFSMKMHEFRLKFRWSLFLKFQLTTFQLWFRWWLGTNQATRHYLNQLWLVYWRVYASLGLNELTLNIAAQTSIQLLAQTMYVCIYIICYAICTWCSKENINGHSVISQM